MSVSSSAVRRAASCAPTASLAGRSGKVRPAVAVTLLVLPFAYSFIARHSAAAVTESESEQ